MYQRKRKILTVDQARVRAEELCVRAEHSSGEIARKLRDWGLTAEQAAETVAAMIATRYIDDRRFCRAYVRDKLEYARWGRIKIALQLRQKGVSRDIVQEALDDIDPERYRALLRQLLAAKNRQLPDGLEPYDRRTRLYRFALQRGFESQVIAAVLPAI